MNNSIVPEQAVIGGLLINPRKIPDVMEIVNHNDFSDHRHQQAFRAIATLCDQNKPIDVITVLEQMADNGFTADLGYFAGLAKNTASTANIRSYAQAVKNNSIELRLAAIGNEIAMVAHGEGSTEEKLESVNQLVSSIGQDQGSGIRDTDTVMKSLIEQWQKRSEIDGSLMGYSTGFESIDKRMMGLQAPDLITIAAQSGKGKTTFAMNMVQAVAVYQKKPTLVFSLEMSAEQLLDRLTAAVGGIPLSMIRNGSVFGSEHDYKIMPAAKKIKDANLFIDDRGGLSVAQIQATARKFFRQHGEGLLVVDYIGLVSGKGLSKQEQTAHVSGSLKSLAKELNIPVVALAQMNRNSVQRGDKRPVASDLRDSAAIEHDSDCLMMLHTDEEQAPLTTEVHFVKHRNGECGVDYLTKNLGVCRFENQEAGYQPPPPKERKFSY
jgi:replicative DNA helicase